MSNVCFEQVRAPGTVFSRDGYINTADYSGNRHSFFDQFINILAGAFDVILTFASNVRIGRVLVGDSVAIQDSLCTGLVRDTASVIIATRNPLLILGVYLDEAGQAPH